MTPGKKGVLLGATLLALGAGVASAQPYPWYPYPPAPPPPPPSWNYDPYTSGLGPCPQRLPGDPPCSYTVAPSYDQPSFWPVRQR